VVPVEQARTRRIAAVDVHYSEERSTAATVIFNHWQADVPSSRLVRSFAPASGYQPGAFYLRELPPIVAIFEELLMLPDIAIIDGYVSLSAGKPGLGAHLFNALDRRVAVIGVAKTEFVGAPSIALLRGSSRAPLFITAAGIDVDTAADHIASMHGENRIPTLLKLVDQLSRGIESSHNSRTS
jgi:deoxyribonuclease V